MQNYIYHFLSAATPHITKHVITSTIAQTPNNHFFIVVGGDEALQHEYIQLFNTLNYKDFEYCLDLTLLKKTKTFFKDDLIVLHGDSYVWKDYLLRRGYSNVYWICWGSGTKINKNLKSLLHFFYKRWLYKKLAGVIVLSGSDAIDLKKNFGISNLSQISYLSDSLDKFNYEAALQTNKEVLSHIYVGNNTSCMPSYIPLVELISEVTQNVSVTAMLNYDLVKDETYTTLLSVGHKKFGDRFKTDEKFYPLQEFPNYMDKCDTYICSVEEQTGLGAIYCTLKQGKKLFLKGNNYNFITSIGCKVFHVDEISSMDEVTFLKPLDNQTKQHNFNAINKYLDIEKVRKQWEIFYNSNTPQSLLSE